MVFQKEVTLTLGTGRYGLVAGLTWQGHEGWGHAGSPGGVHTGILLLRKQQGQRPVLMSIRWLERALVQCIYLTVGDSSGDKGHCLREMREHEPWRKSLLHSTSGSVRGAPVAPKRWALRPRPQTDAFRGYCSSLRPLPATLLQSVEGKWGCLSRD